MIKFYSLNKNFEEKYPLTSISCREVRISRQKVAKSHEKITSSQKTPHENTPQEVEIMERERQKAIQIWKEMKGEDVDKNWLNWCLEAVRYN